MVKQIRQEFEGLLQLLIENFDVEGRRLAGSKGIHLAAEAIDLLEISMAERERVPLKNICSMKWEKPACAFCSSRDPILTQMPTVTDLATAYRSVTTRMPLSSTSLRYKMLSRTSGLWCPRRRQPHGFFAAEPNLSLRSTSSTFTMI